MNQKMFAMLLTGALACAVVLPVAAAAVNAQSAFPEQTVISNMKKPEGRTDEGAEIRTMEETLLTRAGMAEQLYALAGRPAVPAGVDYPDVPHDFEVIDAVRWAAAQKLIDADPDGSFRPADVITREAAITALWRYAGSPTSTHPVDLDYPDTGEISGWAREAYAWAEENGLLFTEHDVLWWPEDEADDSLYPQAEASWDFVSTVLDAFSAK